MLNLTAAVLLQVAAVSGVSQSYADAHKETQATGRPLVVLVSADWCAACTRMKSDTLPVLEKRGALKKVAFATVNRDKQLKLAKRVMQGELVPQLVMYYRLEDGKWKRRSLTGNQSPDVVEAFLEEGIKLANKTKTKTVAKVEKAPKEALK